MLRVGVIILFTIAITGCATAPEDIPARYIPLSNYSNLSCDSLNQVKQEKYAELSNLYTLLDERNTQDIGNAAIGTLFWFPSLFALQGDGPETEKFATLLGEYRSINSVYESKGCDSYSAQNNTSRQTNTKNRKDLDRIGREIIQ